MVRLIKDKGVSKRLISANKVSEALNAEDTGISIDTRRGPVSLYSLQQFLVERLRSTGGRPRLEGTSTVRDKIPLFIDDKEKLKQLTEYYKETEGITVTVGQIASALIHREVSMINFKKLKRKPRNRKAKNKRPVPDFV